MINFAHLAGVWLCGEIDAQFFADVCACRVSVFYGIEVSMSMILLQ